MSMSDRSDGIRLRLKRQSGWFAAGQEVDWALQLLSDAAFKLFVWLCLHAERSRGAASATPAELGRTLNKNEHQICLALEELERQGVCNINAEGVIEIRDRFWPYQRQCQSSASNESHHYVAEVKRRFSSAVVSRVALQQRMRNWLYRSFAEVLHSFKLSTPFCWARPANIPRSRNTGKAHRSAACITSPICSRKCGSKLPRATGAISPIR